MGKLAIRTSVLTVALTIAFSLVIFFSNSWFTRVTSDCVEFEAHKTWSAQEVARLEASDNLISQRQGALEKRLDSIDMKLDRLLERSK
jgi:hypothetical protein